MPAPIQIGSPRRSLRRDFLQDLRYALGMLRRQPGFAAAAILTLALGIGANSAIFALVDAALLRPLPLPAPDRLLVASERIAESSRERISPNDLLDWRARSRSFEAIAGFVPGVGGMVMAGRDRQAETVSRQWVTAGFFDVLGAPPVAGRYLQVADDRARMHAVVLSESFWRTRFDGDPNMLGHEIRLDGTLYTIVGIAPNIDRLLGKTDIWAMMNIEGAPPRARNAHMLRVVARLRTGVTIASATSDLSVIADALARDYPKTNAGRGVSLESLVAFIIGADLRQTALLFVGVVLFVLLICCANVANLLLVRGAARSRELAIRAAIGADRPRLIRQLLTESLVLSLLGGLLGLALAAAILRVVPSIIPDRMLPPALVLTMDLRVVLFCFGATFLVGLLFGLAPAWRTTSMPLGQTLAIDGRTVAGAGDRLRNLFVAAEVAIAVLLRVGAGLLLRTLLAVETIDRGYRAESVLTMMVDPLGSRYPTDEKLMRRPARVAAGRHQLEAGRARDRWRRAADQRPTR